MDELSSKLLEELIKTKNALEGCRKRTSELEGSLPFRGELVSEELPFEEKGTEIRVRIQSPSKFSSDSFRRKPFPPKAPKPGVFVIYGCPRGNWVGGRCQVGMQIQSLRFVKDKGWTTAKVKAYLKGHDFKVESSLAGMRTGEVLEKSILESKPLTVKGVALKAGRWNRYYYPKDELEKAAKTLSGKPIVVDHGKGVRDIVGQVIKGWWDKDTELLKFEGEILSDDIKVLIKRGLVHFTSPGSDFIPANTEHGLTATNITFYELALTTHPAFANGIKKNLESPYPYRRPEIERSGVQMSKDGKREELEAEVKPAPGVTKTDDSSSDSTSTGDTGTVTTGGETGTGEKPPTEPTVLGVDVKALKEKVSGLEAKVGSLTKELEAAKATKKAEEDARAKAEADAKITADAEAKAKEEAEAKVVAETKAREEAEAKAKADAEAKVNAETEAKAKAEAEAKAKTEAEAKVAAEARVKEEVVKPPKEEIDISKLSSSELLILREKKRGHVAKL